MKKNFDLNLPNFNDLEYFLVICETKSFSRASEILNLAQSTLSMAIKKLEDILKTQLFIRTTKGVALTSSGKLFEIKAKKILQDWRDVSNLVHYPNEVIKGRYFLGMNVELGINILPKCIPGLLASNNQLELDLIYDSSLKIQQKVIDSQIDVGVIVDGKHHLDLIAKKIYTGFISVWISSKKIKENPNIDYINGTAVLLYNPLMNKARLVLRALNNLGIKYSRTIPCPNNLILEELAYQNAGIAIGPDWLFEKKLQILPVNNIPKVPYELFAIYRVENKSNASIKNIIENITKCLI